MARRSTERVHVHVYPVREMYEYELDTVDDQAALVEALKRVRFAKGIPVPADCAFVAVAPKGARRDIYGRRKRRA